MTKDFPAFRHRIETELFSYGPCAHNEFLERFARGNFSLEQLQRFTVQFFVFSNHFIIPAAKKLVNARSAEERRQSIEILANELGVRFTNFETGSVEGGTFSFDSNHYHWLEKFGESINLSEQDLGQWEYGSPETHFFCEQLEVLYGSRDKLTALAAAFVIEACWAARLLWKPIRVGLNVFSERERIELDTNYFKFHDGLEDQHGQHTWTELREVYSASDTIDEDHFIAVGKEMLDAVTVFFRGLNRVVFEEYGQ